MTISQAHDDAHDKGTITKGEATITRYVPLAGLLPPGHCLAVYPPLCTVTHLSSAPFSNDKKEQETPLPRLLVEAQLAPAELSLLLPLLEAHPDYCPTEVLLASYAADAGMVSEQMVQRARQQLHRASARGEWSQVTYSVRHGLSRVRQKIRPLGLTLVAMVTTGYFLKRNGKADD